jgi:hypothetical protein
MKSVRYFLTIGFFISVPLIWVNCHKDGFKVGGETSMFSMSHNSGLEMSYEVESIALHTPVNMADTSKLTDADRILGAPKIRRQAIKCQVAADGNLSAAITELEPKHTYRPKSNSLPDDSPQVVKTLIANGQADNYDKAGKLIVSNTVKSENLKSLIDCMTNIRIDPAQVESFIEKARTAGQLAFEKDKIVGIRNTLPTGEEVLMVYDLNRFVLLSFEVYRADKTIESRQIFFIQGDYKNPVLTGINQQHYFKSAASGVAMVATNYQQFDDFQFVNHLK